MPDKKLMRVSIVAELCQGHNRCCLVAPELFESDDEGNARVRGDGSIPANLIPKARLAVANCPEHAVRLTSDDEEVA
jgi:ferredoxin